MRGQCRVTVGAVMSFCGTSSDFHLIPAPPTNLIEVRAHKGTSPNTNTLECLYASCNSDSCLSRGVLHVNSKTDSFDTD
jgi:hypothetical protein